MKKFASRSLQKEILDQDNIPFEDIKQNMKELNVINTLLGGHQITLHGFRTLAAAKKSVSVCEIGCGGGDNLAAIERYSLKRNIALQLTGIDIKQKCIEYAQSSNKLSSSTNFICSDYQLVQFGQKPDIIFSSLFCHHFSHADLVKQVSWMKANSNIGFFINDLQRNALAYYSIKLLTQLFSSSYLVKNDAPLSVQRGFHKTELQQIFREANIAPVAIYWKWAFRYLVVYKHAST